MEHDVHHRQRHLHQQQAMDMDLPPGFRFHPTDEELITHYLARKAADPRFAARAVGEADLNKCEPWDLPSRAPWGEKEWYFFCVKDRKYPTGLRTNRATESGYWKATGKDREIFRGKALVGMKKTLVFYTGRAPRGGKTGWVMHEYRLEGKHHATTSNLHLLPCIEAAGATSNKDDEWVLCRVFKKNIIEPPSAAGAGKRTGSPTFMGMEDDVGPSMTSMADDELAATTYSLPPLMDVPVSGGPIMSSLSAAAAASIEPLPPPSSHVTCFSNALLPGQFLNPTTPCCFTLIPSVPAPAHGAAVAADHLATTTASASPPFLPPSSVRMRYGAGAAGGTVQLEGGGGWYGNKLGELMRERRLSGASPQDTGLTLTSEVNPAEISSSSRQQQRMNDPHHQQASLWDY